MKIYNILFAFVIVFVMTGCGTKLRYASNYDAIAENDAPVDVQASYYDAVNEEIKKNRVIADGIAPVFGELAKAINAPLAPHPEDKEATVTEGDGKTYSVSTFPAPPDYENLAREKTKQIELIVNAINKSVDKLTMKIAAPKKFTFAESEKEDKPGG